MKNETWFVLKQDSLNHTLAEYVCTRRRFKVNRVENEVLYRYIHTKKKKEIIILSFRLIMKNFIALYFYTLFIAQRELLNIKFKNKLNLDFFSMRDFSDYDVILIVRKSLYYLDYKRYFSKELLFPVC